VETIYNSAQPGLPEKPENTALGMLLMLPVFLQTKHDIRFVLDIYNPRMMGLLCNRIGVGPWIGK